MIINNRMYLYFEIFGRHIPSYGAMIVLGVILGNIIAVFFLKHYQLDFYNFIILEAYTFLGAFIGAKLLYLLVSANSINWSEINSIEKINELMQSGFVFYGGLIGGMLMNIIAGKIHHIDSIMYMKKLIFLIPWVHGFGRLGCFFAGCCYGMPYDGIFSVRFPSGSLAPSDTNLFPIQIVEAICLIILAVIILIIQFIKKDSYATIYTYLVSYSLLRFVLEFLRYDKERGVFLYLSTSQWISIFILIGTITIACKIKIAKSFKRTY